MFGKEIFHKTPNWLDSLGIEYVGFLNIATVVEVDAVDNFVEVLNWDFGEAHAAQIEDADVLLCVVGDGSEGEDDEHQEVDDVVVFVQADGVVEFVGS